MRIILGPACCQLRSTHYLKFNTQIQMTFIWKMQKRIMVTMRSTYFHCLRHCWEERGQANTLSDNNNVNQNDTGPRLRARPLKPTWAERIILIISTTISLNLGLDPFVVTPVNLSPLVRRCEELCSIHLQPLSTLLNTPVQLLLNANI